MPALLTRTSTHKILELYFELRTTKPDEITKALNQRGHSRKVSDVRYMINNLKSIGIIGNESGEQMALILSRINPDHPSPSDIFVAKAMLEYLSNNGLAILPFLKAVSKHPNQNKMIQLKLVDYGPEFGFYNLREGDDVSAAMRNFASYLGFVRKPPRKGGVYELTNLGKKVVELGIETIVSQRIKCKVGEPCREVCPTNAISLDRITNSCVECGLCTRVCPYGAIRLDCKGKIKMNTEICSKNNGKPTLYKPCSIRPIQAEEITMQHWIKSLLNLMGLPTEIPGVGEYPDLVTAQIPSFIEVKKNRLTARRIERLLKFQLPRYMKQQVIEATLKRLKERKGFLAEKPELFVIIAPQSSVVQEFLQRAKCEGYKYPISFVSSEALYFLSSRLLEGSKVQAQKIWEQIEPWEDGSELIFSKIRN